VQTQVQIDGAPSLMERDESSPWNDESGKASRNMHTILPASMLSLPLALLGSERTPTPVKVEGEHAAFEVLTGETTGLRKIIEDWAAEERQAQGGKYLSSHGWWLWGLTAIDYDNDGDTDLLPSHHGLPGGLMLKNQFKETGKLTFIDATRSFGFTSRQMTRGMGRKTLPIDLNGDGWLDLVGIRSPHLFNNEGKGFTAFGARKGFSSLWPLAVEDVTGDDVPDIIRHVDALYFDPAARDMKVKAHPPPSEARTPPAVRSVIEGKAKSVRHWSCQYMEEYDLTGDGIRDVVISCFAGYSGHPLCFLLSADTNGALTDRTTESGLPRDTAPILLSDLNADGHVDVVSTRGEGGVFLNDGKGRFTLKAGPATDFLRKGGPYVHRAYASDFEADGDLDLVLVNPRYKQTEVHENTGGGQFKRLLAIGSWDSDPVEICDVNDDGLPDVAIGGSENTITLLVNRSKAGKYTNLYLRMEKPNLYAAGARVQAFKAGTLDGPNALPFLRAVAPQDGTPVRIGLGEATAFDLRVTFPGKEKKTVEHRNVGARPRMKLTPDGKPEEVPGRP
jgi:FG-GAP-like repeat